MYNVTSFRVHLPIVTGDRLNCLMCGSRLDRRKPMLEDAQNRLSTTTQIEGTFSRSTMRSLLVFSVVSGSLRLTGSTKYVMAAARRIPQPRATNGSQYPPI